MTRTLDKIEAFVEHEIRPILRKDGGDISMLELENGVLWVRLLGKCSHCPSAQFTLKEVIEKKIKAEFPEIEMVELDISVNAELNELAKKILRKEIHLNR